MREFINTFHGEMVDITNVYSDDLPIERKEPTIEERLDDLERRIRALEDQATDDIWTD